MTLGKIVSVIAALTLIAVVSALYSAAAGIAIALSPFVALAALIMFVSMPALGLAALMAEVICGGNGHWLEFRGGALTPRYLLIVAVFLGFAARILLLRRTSVLRSRAWIPLGLFCLVVVYGIACGYLNANRDVLGEPQVWLYLIVYPIVVSLWSTKAFPDELLRMYLWSAAGMAGLTLLLMLAANLAPEPFFELYRSAPLERMRITAPALAGTSLTYVFWGNSSVAGVALAVSLLLLDSGLGPKWLLPKRSLQFIAILCAMTMLFSMTRGTWGQLALMLALVGVDIAVRRRIRGKSVLALGAIAIIGVTAVVSSTQVREAFVTRFDTLMPANRVGLEASDSMVTKALEAEQQILAIANRPLLGYGFGVGDYGNFGNFLADASRFHNWFLGLALKTGLIGVASFVWLFASVCYRAIRAGARVGKAWPAYRAVLSGWAYGLIGIAFVSTSNPHAGTPAFVITLGLGMAFVDLVNHYANSSAKYRQRNNVPI